jgi:hypothetical protein
MQKKNLVNAKKARKKCFSKENAKKVGSAKNAKVMQTDPTP